MFQSEISVLKTSFQKFLKQKISQLNSVQVPFIGLKLPITYAGLNGEILSYQRIAVVSPKNQFARWRFARS